MQAYLAAVQAEIKREHYRSEAAFVERTVALAEAAVQGAPAGPRVVAFPEAYALPLVFWLGAADNVLRASSSLAAGLRLLAGGLRRTPAALLRHPRPDLVYHLRLPQVWPAYHRAFSEAARRTSAYVIGGSLFGPLLDWEPARGLHAAGRRSYNWLGVYTPRGTILARPAKVRLTPGERRAFLSSAPFGSQVFATAIGRMATLICLDAFHESLVERADAAGAWLLVQPSANAAAWEGPWSADPTQVEGEVWLREGLSKKLVGRENLRYGLNPMLNGDFYDLHFEGRSSVVAAGEFLALAAEPRGDDIVAALVEAPAH